MGTVRGTYRDGQVILDGPPPADWPDGAEVRLELVDPAAEGDPDGILGNDPESIARWEAYMDALHQKYRMTDEQAAEWDRILREKKEADKAMWEERCRKIEGLFP